jgi:hypothetical protein
MRHAHDDLSEDRATPTTPDLCLESTSSVQNTTSPPQTATMRFLDRSPEQSPTTQGKQITYGFLHIPRGNK